ncbi:MAG: AMP-binding protein [Proteobacteria bacterium]|nr:AMP-binding protein [Desulfobacula sp.]MBU3951912.1 AMP-binding protein [Pseudomonadota bacterium]MBU4129249.1 AMP-binding protein [Pseudomonadota bacterium]
MSSLYELSFFDIYEKNARLNKDSCAIHWNKEDISYSDLFLHTCRLAKGLSGLNLAPGARIAVLSFNHPFFFHLFGAASALNLCLVLINRRLSPDEMAHIIEDTTPSVLFSDQDMAGQAKTLASTHACLAHCFTIDKNVSSLYQSPPLTTPVEGLPDDPFMIIHTAAVQGKPRGAVLSQKNIILSNLQLVHTFGLNKTKTYLNILPLFHIMGVNLGLGMLMAGGKNVILERFNPQQTLDLIQEQKVTLLGSFPPIVTTLLDTLEQGNFDLSSLEITAGLEMPDMVKKWEAATGATFWTMYGQTETSGLISFSEYFKRPGSAGELSLLATVQIADDADTFLPMDTMGEILVKGPLVFQGYWNSPEVNETTFRNGWHHTGDLGMIDSDGFLFFKGRKPERELIKPGGENVFPVEVENAILQHEAVENVCVFGVPDPKFGEGIKAVIALHPGKALTKEDLIAFTGSLIAGYKKPRYVEFIDRLPRTGDGSIDRAQIKETYS